MKNTTITFENGKMIKTVTDRPVPTRDDMLHTTLMMACTSYTRVHNPFALGLYFKAVDDVVELTKSGLAPIEAIKANFTGHMLNYLLRKVFPKAVR